MKKVFAAGIALAVLFGGNTATFASQGINPVKISSTDFSYSSQATEALNYINTVRSKMGIPQVKLNPFLVKAAENHANYISTTGDYMHEENSEYKGFTGVEPWDRVKAVGGDDTLIKSQTEIISFDTTSPTKAVEDFLNTVYHRQSLMSPYATDIGFGIVGKAVVIEISHTSKTKAVVAYPYDGQTNVVVAFNGNEDPNPLTQFGIKTSGQIITLYVPYVVDGIDAKVTNSKGESIPFFTLEDTGYWHMIPKTALGGNETYTVSVNYTPTVGSETGKSSNKTWSFTTGDGEYVSKPSNSGNKNTTPSNSTSAIKYNSNNIGIKIDGRYVSVNPKAKIVGESTFIPLRGVFEAIGAKLTWNGDDQSIDIVKGDTKVHLQIGNTTATVNGNSITLAKAPFISQEGSTYVPLRFASEALGAKVTWDGDNYTAVIDTK